MLSSSLILVQKKLVWVLQSLRKERIPPAFEGERGQQIIHTSLHCSPRRRTTSLIALRTDHTYLHILIAS